jgi:hypothetical protein
LFYGSLPQAVSCGRQPFSLGLFPLAFSPWPFPLGLFPLIPIACPGISMKVSHLLLAGLLIAAAWFGARYYLQKQADIDKKDQESERVSQGFLKTKKEFNDKLEDIKQRREEVVNQIARLEERLKASANKLRELGVSTPDELDKNDAAKLEYGNATRLMNDVRKYRVDIETFDRAIVRIEAALADIDRQELMDNAGITEEQSRQLETIVRDVDDRLLKPASPVEELKTEEILNEILGKKE